MRLRAERIALGLTAALVFVACSTDQVEPVDTIPPGEGGSTPTAAVEELVEAIGEPDFADASRLAVPGHAALASLAEGATFDAVADALRDGDQGVAANFWSGFAQGAGSYLSEPVEVAAGGTVTQDDLVLSEVVVSVGDGGTRTLLLADVDGYRVDLFASFGAGLADKMVAPVERLLTTQTNDARLILSQLRDIVPSLLVAASAPGTTSEVSQQILALVEVITRVG